MLMFLLRLLQNVTLSCGSSERLITADSNGHLKYRDQTGIIVKIACEETLRPSLLSY
jgi:hypothetical protein